MEEIEFFNLFLICQVLDKKSFEKNYIDNYFGITKVIFVLYQRERNMSVIVKIQDPTGAEIGSFEAEDEKSLCEMAAMHGIDILKSCGAGFCWVCLCEVLEGWDALDENKVGASGFNLAKDENWDLKQILWCVGWIKSEMFSDEKTHEITLKKMY